MSQSFSGNKVFAKFSIIIGLLLLCFGAGMMLRQSLTSSPPVLWVERDTVLVGDIYESQIVEKVFQLHNRGNEPLQLSVGKTSCSCLTAVLDKPVVAPKDHAELSMRVQAPGHPDVPFTVVTSVHSNAPQTPELFFTVKGVSRRFLLIEPSAVNVRSIDISAFPVSYNVSIQPTEGVGDRTVAGSVRATATASHISPKIDPVEGGFILAIQIDKPSFLGPMREQVILSFDRLEGHTIRIPVLGHVTGMYGVEPSILFFDLSDKEEATRTCKVTNLDPASEVEVTVAPPVLAKVMKLTAHKEGSTFTLRARLDTSEMTRRLEGRLLLSITGHDDKGAVGVIVPVIIPKRPPAGSRNGR